MTNISAPRVLIEDWLPVTELGIESRRERAVVMDLPPLFSLHVWWARRPLVASAGVILASLLPSWSEELSAAFPGEVRLSSETYYKRWFLHLCGIWGDPVAGRAMLDRANAEGQRIQGNGYGYKQAYKNSPNPADLALLHRVLERSWGELPNVVDPTAGGGSIPYEAVRYGLPAHANDLNQVAAVTLRAGVEIAAKYGPDLADDLDKWGQILIGRLAERLRPYFLRANEAEKIVGYLNARSVTCPRTGKPVPLAPNWWISKAKGSEVAARLITERNGEALADTEFELLHGQDAVEADPERGTVSRGAGLSPWDGLVIDGDYIKAEAQAGRLGSILYAVAIRLPEVQANGKTKWVRAFRAPTRIDLDALAAAEKELVERLPAWLAAGVVPTEEIQDGLKTAEPIRYGMRQWRDMFSSRQLLVHGTFAEELRVLTAELAEHDPERGASISGLLALMQGKALNRNSLLATWDVGQEKIRSVFDTHNLAFKWSYSEFEASQLFQWVLGQRQLGRAYAGISGALQPGSTAWVIGGSTVSGSRSDLRNRTPALPTVSVGSAGDLGHIVTGSRTLVCIDPPYYDNVMYGELSDFFGVW